MPECYIRGSTIKYLRIPDEIIDMVKEEAVAKGRGRGGLQQQKQQKGRGLGGTGRGGCHPAPGSRFPPFLPCTGAFPRPAPSLSSWRGGCGQYLFPWETLQARS